jgi:pimeloyl-ACP methyl ester carboxylesterase
MHMTGELPIADARHDLRLHLAGAGVRTWGLDYRSHAVPPEASARDLESLAGWTADLWEDDVAWAAGFVRAADPGPIYVAGFSHGAALAYRLARRPNEPLAGLIILDGALGTVRPGETDGPALDVAGGRLPWAERRRLLAAVRADPASPSPLAGYRTSGEALADILFTAPSFGGDGGLANTRAEISDITVLAALLASYDRWWPRSALAAEPGAPPERRLPVLAFASTRLGERWVERVRESARAYGGAEATVHELPDYGHLDVLVGRAAARDVYGPVLAWLTRNAR